MSISQNLPQESESLSLDFAKSKKLDSQVTFTRSGGLASYVNDDGVINYAATNQPRFDHSVKEVKNLYTNSEDTSLWLVNGLSSRNPTAITAPDGSLTGNLVVEDSANAQHLVYQDIGTVTIGATYTFSIYAKQYTSDRTLSITFHGGTYPSFDLGRGVIVSSAGYTAKMENVGNGWYRCSVTGTFASNVGRVYAIIYNNASQYIGNGTSGMYLWGGQFEIGSTVSEYVKTTTSNESVYQIDSKGLIIEEQRTNFITVSNKSDIGNYFQQDVYVKRNAELAPDNTFSADKIVATVTGGTNTCFTQKWEPVAINTATYVFSVFLKPGTSLITTLNMQLTGGTYQQSVATISWETKTITYDSNSTATLTPYGNGWYRASIALTNNNTNNTIYPRVYVRDQGSSNVRGHFVYIWGWQVETVSYSTNVASTFPTSYLPSTETFISRSTTGTKYGQGLSLTTAAINTPRYDYFPYSEYANFLLLEPASTNLLSYTESFGNWTVGAGVTVTSNVAATTAPDGSSTADKITEAPAANGNVQHGAYYSRAGSNETVTFSIFAKKAERSKIYLQLSNFLNEAAGATYDLELGSATLDTGLNGTDYVNSSAEIIPYPNGWFRCILTTSKKAVNTTNNAFVALYNNAGTYIGNGTSGAYLWGAQLETGTSASSYIPATGASNVTRAADIYSSAVTTRTVDAVSVRNINTSSWFNNRTVFGSIYLEVDGVKKVGANGSYARLFQISGATNANDFNFALIPNSLSAYFDIFIDSVQRSTYASINLATGKNKACFIFETGQIIYVLNGQLVTRQVLTGDIMTKLTRLGLGCDVDGGSSINGTMSKFVYYPFCLALSDAITLTK